MTFISCILQILRKKCFKSWIKQKAYTFVSYVTIDRAHMWWSHVGIFQLAKRVCVSLTSVRYVVDRYADWKEFTCDECPPRSETDGCEGSQQANADPLWWMTRLGNGCEIPHRQLDRLATSHPEPREWPWSSLMTRAGVPHFSLQRWAWWWSAVEE